MTRKVLIDRALKRASQGTCSGRDLNPQAFRHTPLKRTCLPFHHPSVEREQTFRRRQRLASVDCILLTHARNRGLETNRILCRMKYQRFVIKLRAGE
jgi:hypothetical protein